jgi:hypothetical protein
MGDWLDSPGDVLVVAHDRSRYCSAASHGSSGPYPRCNDRPGLTAARVSATHSTGSRQASARFTPTSAKSEQHRHDTPTGI